jgi:hypothetical protein
MEKGGNMNTVTEEQKEIYFQKAFDATCQWFDRQMVSPARVKEIRRWAKLGGCTLDEMIDYAEEFLACMAE